MALSLPRGCMRKQLIGFVLGCMVLAMPALAADLDQDVPPLIVIRFNQTHVDYAMPLYNTVSRALEVKPSAMFDIVSVSSAARTPQDQQYNNQIATQNVHKVLATLHNMGLPQSRIHLTSAADNVPSSEVRIFVR